MTRRTFTAIKTEGGLLPREVLERVAAEDPDLPGLEQEDYHIPPSERLGEAINRSWNRLLGLWEAFTEALDGVPEGQAATGLTRNRWLIPFFDELGYGLLKPSRAVEIEGKSFAISHVLHRTPIHLVGAGLSIDRRSPGVAGAAAAAPHSLTQEFLNRSDEHLWAFVSNGRVLRILRDNYHLSRQAYVEFDLEAIMEGELFSDFRVLWLACHKSRVEAEEPDECWLEAWFQLAREEGVRALDTLRDGVERAIEAFGAGFLRHPSNTRLHESLKSGELDRQEFYRELLRLVYRLIFLFVAEDREVLLHPDAGAEARKRFTRYYASHRLRDLSARRRGTPYDDLWRGLRLVLSKLYDGCPELGLPALGSFLWSSEAVPWIGDAELLNEDALTGLRALCYTEQDHQLLPVNWRTMGSEELGSVYESLLELHPEINRDAATFELRTAAGHERKTTGSYYTPTSLVDRLLESALEPVLEKAMGSDCPEVALLDLKVCDTAAGSGHFLVAAARRIALRLASVRTGDEEASPEAVTRALRDVVGRCIFGVDLNPMAVELCKVSLWMEALEPGKPLSFLDHHIQVGNSLLGTTQQLIQEGIPDEAFREIEGDDKEVVKELRKRNREERESEQIGLHIQFVAERSATYAALEHALDELNAADDSTLDAVEQKETTYRRLLADPRYRTERLLADAWCAAFVWPKTRSGPPPITDDIFRGIERDPDDLPAPIAAEIGRLAEAYNFFHFHLAFPDVFWTVTPGDGEGAFVLQGGFDVLLGNPPWERIKVDEPEWFAERCPAIANAGRATERRRLIAALETEDPSLFRAFIAHKRLIDGASHLLRTSGAFPLCGRGRDINSSAVFAELATRILGGKGLAGLVVPTAVATDDTTKTFFQELMDSSRLVSLFDFENRQAIFPSVHRSYKFCLLTLEGSASQQHRGAVFAFFLTSAKELDDETRRFVLTTEDILAVNPNTRTCPVFRSRRDAALAIQLHNSAPVLVREDDPAGNTWSLRTGALFHAGNDAELFRTRAALEDEGYRLHRNIFSADRELYLPLVEPKQIHQFNHRFGDFRDVDESHRSSQLPDVPAERLEDPTYVVLPRYWIPRDVLEQKSRDWAHPWFMGWRRQVRSTDERTVIATVIPAYGANDDFYLLYPGDEYVELSPCLLANLNTFVLDFLARQKVGGTKLGVYIMKQLPVMPPGTYLREQPWVEGELREWIRVRVSELIATNEEFEGVEIWSGEGPYRYDAGRRSVIRAELDALYFHLYGVERRDVEYVMDAFPITRRADVTEFGEYRRKRGIVSVYDAMAEAAHNGRGYRTSLEPPPGDGLAAHEGRTRGQTVL